MSTSPADSDTVVRHYRAWKRLAPLGLLGVGFGASLLGHATIKKFRSPRSWGWVVAGTLSLIALNAGLSMFGDAVKHRTLYEIGSGKDV
jgi:hypothetical protein